jgi:hypothetical protein
MESQTSLQHFNIGLEHIEQGSLRSLMSGQIRVDVRSCKERVAMRCLVCFHQIWVKSKEAAGLLMINFRKSDRGAQMGYLISAEIPRSKQCKQIVCLHCVNNLLGVVADSADRLAVTLNSQKDREQDAYPCRLSPHQDSIMLPILLMRQQSTGEAWSQTLELSDGLIGFLRRENTRTMPGQRQISTAAAQIGGKGMAKGVRPRAGGPTR